MRSLGLITLTPLLQSSEHNIVRVQRQDELSGDILHVGGGHHEGIVIQKLAENIHPEEKCDIALSFCVWMQRSSDDGISRQEIRKLSFSFFSDVNSEDQNEAVQLFFKKLIQSFPKDYATFLTRVLKLLQQGFSVVRQIEIDMQFASPDQAMLKPDPRQYDSSSEVEDVTVGHVQQVLEHAYPNGLTVALIAESLRCTEEQVEEFLNDLKNLSIARQVHKEWIRCDTVSVNANPSSVHVEEHPIVAIITCLFAEKQAVDAIIERSTTVHRYRSGGDSNIYTMGWVGNIRVVSTKLAMVGDSREATTSAGSITTRLLGNFQHVEHVFIVGVGGGVAHFTDSKQHVRLGDVVVSTSRPSAYIYAHGFTADRQTGAIAGFLTRKWNPSDLHISDMVENRDKKTFDNDCHQFSANIIEALNFPGTGDVNFARPSPETDVLAVHVGDGNMLVVPHPDPDRHESLIHTGAIGAMTTIRRNEESPESSDGLVQRREHELRDRLAMEFGLRAMDAGFESVIEAVQGSRIDSWALIRGVADYQHGQSRSSRVWQPYAAVRSAAVLKAILLRLG